MLKLGPQDDMYTDEDKQLRVCIYLYTSTCLSTCLFVYLSTLPICLSISVYPSIYLSIYAVAHVYMYTSCLRIVFQQVFAAVWALWALYCAYETSVFTGRPGKRCRKRACQRTVYYRGLSSYL